MRSTKSRLKSWRACASFCARLLVERLELNEREMINAWLAFPSQALRAAVVAQAAA
jgi:hypothetical protein